MIEYVLGYAFSEDFKYVILILKDHPLWQKGKLNGVGGKIEQGENPSQAMDREFREEAADTGLDWRYVFTIQEADHRIFLFTAIAPMLTMTEHPPIHRGSREIPAWNPMESLDCKELIANNTWIIPCLRDWWRCPFEPFIMFLEKNRPEESPETASIDEAS